MKQLGQLFMLAIGGTELTAAEKMIIRQMQPAGVTLFTRNLRSVDQIIKLVTETIALFDEKPIIAIDQEGGLKERLPVPPFTHWPGNNLLGDLFLATGSDHLTRMQFAAIGRELAAIGVNLNFAPVMDVVPTTKKAYMAGRAFSHNPDVAAKLSVAALEAMADTGVLACGKHFPGHGDTEVDSHLNLPRINRTLLQLEHQDLIPFRQAIDNQVPMIMTTHIIFPELDDKLPATLSPAAIDGLLRKQMGFAGLVATDDMNMMAITSNYGRQDAAKLSLLAGANLLLYCEGVDHGFAVFEWLSQEIASDQALASVCSNSVQNVLQWKTTYLSSPPLPDIEKVREITGKKTHRDIAHEIKSRATSL